MSDYEETLAQQLHFVRAPVPIREFKFNDLRRWRFDFSWPDLLLAVEVEGATWTGGRHTRGGGFANDCEKYNAAAIDGWCVLRFPTDQIKSGEALIVIEKALEVRRERNT